MLYGTQTFLKPKPRDFPPFFFSFYLLIVAALSVSFAVLLENHKQTFLREDSSSGWPLNIIFLLNRALLMTNWNQYVIFCLVWRTGSVSGGQKWPGLGGKVEPMFTLREEGLLPDQVGRVPALSQMPHDLSSSSFCHLYWASDFLPISYTQLCVFIFVCMIWGYNRNHISFWFSNSVWYLLSTEKNWGVT